MKVLDATVIIAFLNEMDYPDGLAKLSKYHELIVPKGVADEIKKPPGKEILEDFIKRNIVRIVKVDRLKIDSLLKQHPQLHRGECEAIAFMQTSSNKKCDCIVSDDSKARKIFHTLNFKWTEELLDIMKDKGIIDSETHASKNSKLQNSMFYSRGQKS